MNFTPDITVDGAGAGNPGPSPFSYSEMANAINARLATPAPIGITVSGQISGGGGGGGVMRVSVDVDVETAQTGNYTLYVSAVEKYIHLPSPNGDPDHYNTFRQLNGNSGQPIDLSTTGVQHFDIDLPYHDIYEITDMRAIVWVQNDTTREVVNAGRSDLLVPYFVSMEAVGPTTLIAGSSEVVDFAGNYENLGFNDDTYNITVENVPAGWTYSYTTPAGTFGGPSTLPVSSGVSGSFDLSLDSQGNAGPAVVTFRMQSQGDPSNEATLELIKLNGADVLLVDDDNGAERQDVIEESLDAAGVVYGTIARTDGVLSGQQLQDAAQIVIWNCGSGAGATNPSLDADDRAALGAFLDLGGRAIVAGADVSFDLANPGSPNYTAATEQWHNDYLHAVHGTNVAFSWSVEGTTGDPIGDGLAFGLHNSGAYSQTTPDGITAGSGAEVAFTYLANQWDVGLRWAGAHQIVFLAFGLEGITAQSTRDMVVDRALTWLGFTTGVEAPAGVAPRIALAQNTPNPFRGDGTTIHYQLAEAGNVSLAIFDVAGRQVRQLVRGPQGASSHQVTWDGRTEAGRWAPNGVYFYTLEAPGVTATRRMVLSR